MAVQKWAKNYLVGSATTGDLPLVEFLYRWNAGTLVGCPTSGTMTSCYLSQSNRTIYPNFDLVGSATAFKDVIVNYLGGNYRPANPKRPDSDDQGFKGLDPTEMLDGMLCRGHVTQANLLRLTQDVMDFRSYKPEAAPFSAIRRVHRGAVKRRRGPLQGPFDQRIRKDSNLRLSVP